MQYASACPAPFDLEEARSVVLISLMRKSLKEMLIEEVSEEVKKENHMLVSRRQPELYIAMTGQQVPLC